MTKAFVVDVARCSGCRNCQVVCKDEHCDQAWMPYAQAQPEVGQFWCEVKENVRGKVPMVWVSYVPTLCSHCTDAPCTEACPAGAFERREDGLLLINPETCTGCLSCVDACPIGAIFPNEQLGIAQKCTGCAHLLDNGWSVPRCVDSCPHEALRFGDVEQFAGELDEATCYPGLEGAGAALYVLNYPKRFCAGTVVDLSEDEVVIGAKVELLDGSGTSLRAAETDDFGDFKFDQIEPARYTVRITSDIYGTKELAADATEADVALTEIALR